MLLILWVVLAYAPAIGAGFIWDDDTLLTANPQMRSTHGLVEIWQGKNSRDYTPLTLTAFWIEHQVLGDTPTGYHVINILLHAIAAVLLWRILEALLIPGAWFGALLFAIHPVNVASVAWVAELKNTLSGVLFIASLLCFLLFYTKEKCGLYAASIVLFLLAGLSKGAVVTLPMLLLGCVLWRNGKITRHDLIRVIPFALIALGIALLTIHYQSRAVDYALLPPGIAYRIARAGMAVCLYLRELFFPVGLSPMAPQWLPNLHSPLAWMPLVVIIAALALFFCKRKTWGRPLLFASGAYLWMLLPVLGFVWMALLQETPCADWWQYLAAPAVFACIAAGYASVMRNAGKNVRFCLQAATGIILMLLFIQTWRRCAIYESMETYCRAVVVENPHAWSMQNNFGVALKQQGDLIAAIACYHQALRDNPRYMEARNNLGNALTATGDLPGAEAEFIEASHLAPTNPEVLGNLADVYFREGKIREAIATQAAAIQNDRYNATRYNKFGLLLAANKQFAQAVVCFQDGIVLAPNDIGLQINLTRALLTLDRRAEAATAAEHALETAKKTGNEKLIQMVSSILNQTRQH
ncbi:MAG: tetratricopeptide repeat protein [Chthoniobacteraceae bacterium]